MTTIQAPTGTVTFLFTDIEGSTRLWDEHPTTMAEALVVHDEVLGSVTGECDGYVFSQAGDGWGIAFASALGALTAALNIQHRLSAADWPDDIGSLQVRIGIHTGTAAERGGDYFGTTVNRAARVSGVASGGETFVSDAVRSLVADEADPSWRFRDLGEHRLRDLSRPERLWQLDHDEHRTPRATLAGHTAKGNLPRPRGSIVGRADELDGVVACLDRSQVLTLVGVGGVGKTTLSVAAGSKVADSFAGGAWFVDLSATVDTDHLPDVVAGSLGIPPRAEMGPLESLIDGLATESRFVIIDNAEHLIEGVADLVDAIVTAVTDVRILVTSREPLDIRGEEVLRIGPLPVADVDGRSPAAQLFIERARAVAPDLDDEAFQLGIVHAICQRLDGLPLAIELAASQSEVMTPREILAALEGNNLELHSLSRSTVQRHRSLTDLVAWSYDLLTPTEQTVFERLSVFRGGGTIDAAVAVCADDSMSGGDVRAAISILVRKSMVVTQRHEGVTRLTMLETLRQFSADRFAKSVDRNEVARRHAEWFAERSTEGREQALGPQEARYLVAMIADLDNLQSATEWACSNEEYDLLTDIGASVAYLMGSRTRPNLASWIADAVDKIPESHDARLEYALALAGVSLFSGGIAEAPDLFASLTEHVADQEHRAAMTRYVTHVSRFFLGDTDFVISDGAAAFENSKASGLLREAGSIGTDFALALFYSGDTERAKEVAAEVLDLANEAGSPSLLAWALYVEGEILGETNPAHAVELLEESIDNGLAVANEFVVGISLTALSSIAGRRGDIPTALDAMHRCIRLWRTAGNRPQMWTAVRNLVEVLHSLNENATALTLHYAVEADADHAPALFGPFGDHYRAIVAAVEVSLEPAAIESAARHGASFDYPTAAQYALDAVEREMASLEA